MAREQTHKKPPVDARIIAYRLIVQASIIIMCGIGIKWMFFDSVLITTNQMEPKLVNGDRVIYTKATTSAPLKWLNKMQRQKIVVFRQPHDPARMGCLRIAGLPGDVVSISNGLLTVLNEPLLNKLGKENDAESLPKEYSPRDWFDPYHLPKPGQTYKLDTLTNRDLIFLWIIIKQENPLKSYIVHPWLHVNDSVTNTYFIRDFSLYKGPFSAIPEELKNQWFFWDRLLEYLHRALPEKEVNLKFSIMHKNEAISQYTVKQPYYFLVADNWEAGFDSRYKGPVSGSLMKGTVMCVLWSIQPGKGFPGGFRSERTCRIVK